MGLLGSNWETWWWLVEALCISYHEKGLLEAYKAVEMTQRRMA